MHTLRDWIFCAIALIVIFPSYAEETAPGKPEIFTAIHGTVGAGIVCDGQGSMFVGKNGCLLRITPDGRTAVHCNLDALPKGKDYYFKSPLIWDMVFDADGTLVAAAQDRILRIYPDGSVMLVIREDFDGFVGASGLAFDRSGNLYVTSGNRVLRFTPRLERSVFIHTPGIALKWEGLEFDLELKSFNHLAFDPGYKNLYVSEFTSSTLLRYPIRADGTPGEPVIVFDGYTDDLDQAPLNVVFGETGSIYVSNDFSSRILKMDAAGRKSIIPIPGKLRNHMIAFGGRGFEEESLYFTTYDGDYVYKIHVGEKSAVRLK